MKDWQNFENYTAKKDKGKKQPLSGAGVQKQDVLSKRWLTSNKYTDSQSYSIKKADLKQLELDAAMEGVLPKKEISFGGYDWVLLRRKDFDDMVWDIEKIGT